MSHPPLNHAAKGMFWRVIGCDAASCGSFSNSLRSHLTIRDIQISQHKLCTQLRLAQQRGVRRATSRPNASWCENRRLHRPRSYRVPSDCHPLSSLGAAALGDSRGRPYGRAGVGAGVV